MKSSLDDKTAEAYEATEATKGGFFLGGLAFMFDQGLCLLGISYEAGYLWVGWIFLLGRGLWILGWIMMDCSENMVLWEKLDFGALNGIMGGLLGLPSEERMDRTRSGQR